MEVGLDDMLPANLLIDVIGLDCALQLRLPIAKSAILYLAGSETLIPPPPPRSGKWNSEQEPIDVAKYGQ